MAFWWYQAEFRACGKACSSCPHGPYWYAYRREAGKTKSRYVGKIWRPLNSWEDFPEGYPVIEPWHRLISPATYTPDLAWEILRDPPHRTYQAALLEWSRITSQPGERTMEERAWAFYVNVAFQRLYQAGEWER